MNSRVLMLVFGLTALGFAQSPVVPCPPNTAGGVICLAGPVTNSNFGPLQSGQVYHFVTSSVLVPAGATLTVQPGAIVKIAAGVGFAIHGTLDDQGGFYTSIHDDALGGDTNGNGAATQGVPGDWPGMIFHPTSDASTLTGAEVHFGNGIELRGSDMTISNTLFNECAGSGLSLGAPQFPSLATVTNCEFTNCGRPLDRVPLMAVPGLTGNIASGNSEFDALRIMNDPVASSITIGPGNALNGNGVFVICGNGMTVPAGVTLTLSPGCIFKFDIDILCSVVPRIDVDGTLLATGTALTVLEDDSFGGDTNKDGASSLPAPQTWGNVVFGPSSDASVLDTVFIRHAGGLGSAILELDAADVTLNAVDIDESVLTHLDLGNDSFPTVTGCTFQNSAFVAVRHCPLAAIPAFLSNTASGNAGDYILIEGTTPAVTGSTTISPLNALGGNGLFVFDAVTGPDTVAPGGTLTLDAGCVFKMKSGRRLSVDGTLNAGGTALAGVAFTSFADDGLLGDTNGDGGATSPAPGDWNGLVFTNGAGGDLDFTLVRYAGTGTLAAVDVGGGFQLSISNSDIRDSAGHALDLHEAATPTLSGVDLDDNGGLPIRRAPLAAVPGFTGLAGSGNAGGDYVEVGNGTGTQTVSGSVSVGPANTLNGGGVLVMTEGATVNAGATLDVQPGTILKFVPSVVPAKLTANGGTLTLGGIGGDAVCTSFLDDASGGDTNGDGAATSPSPGDWDGVRLISANGSQIDGAKILHAGAPGIRLFQSDATLANVTVRETSGAGLDLSGNSFPSVTDCAFEQGTVAIAGVDINALPGFANNTAALNSVGDYMVVSEGLASDGLLIEPGQAPNGGAFVVTDHIDVPPGTTLNVGAGTVIKFDGAFDVDVDGELQCLGSAGTPVVFTTLDDDFAGDTNKNGAATLPAPGDWGRIDFGAGTDASVLQGALVRFATFSAILLSNASPKIIDCTISNGAGGGLNLFGSSSRPEVRGCHFADNGGAAVFNATLDALPLFRDNTASGNLRDHIRVDSGFVSAGDDVTVSRFNALNGDGTFTINDSIFVLAGGRLALRQGVIFKFTTSSVPTFSAAGILDIEGTGFEPVVITTMQDDDFGGDSNKDGNATSPSAGTWRRVEWSPGTAPSSVRHLRARFGGFGGAMIQVQRNDVGIDAIRADHALGTGVFLNQLDGDATNCVAFGCGLHGLDLGSSATFDVVHATVTGCGGSGINKRAGHVGVAINTISRGNTGANFAGFAPGEILSSNGDAASAGTNGNIDADPEFVDAANGVLALADTSPCLGVADVPAAAALVTDHVEASRILDDALTGIDLPDMGAFERAGYTLAFSGEPRIATTMSFTTQGSAPGTAFLLAGLLDGTQQVLDYGFLKVAPLATVLLIGTAPVGQPMLVPIPNVPALEGFEFGIETLCVTNLNTLIGNFTNRYRGVMFN